MVAAAISRPQIRINTIVTTVEKQSGNTNMSEQEIKVDLKKLIKLLNEHSHSLFEIKDKINKFDRRFEMNDHKFLKLLEKQSETLSQILDENRRLQNENNKLIQAIGLINKTIKESLK